MNLNPHHLTTHQLIEALIWSWWLLGVLSVLMGFWGLLYPVAAMLVALPLLLLTLIGIRVVHFGFQAGLSERILLFVLASVWLSHVVQVFVPETGLDALWYHLPVLEAIITNHRYVYLPQLYQSLNPLLSDSLLGLGLMVDPLQGAKVINYVLGLTLALSTYLLSRLFMNRLWALITVVVVSSFQVVAWQSASAYVDLAKAVWEIAAVYLLVKELKPAGKGVIGSALLFGASLATKQFSILLLPAFFSGWLLFGSGSVAGIALLVSLTVAMPFYLFSYLASGNPLYSFAVHGAKLVEIGNGYGSWVSYGWFRVRSLPLLPWQLLTARDYTSILLALFAPLVWMQRRVLMADKQLRFVLYFGIYQLGVWWLLPPLSTRYALSGFICLLVVVLWAAQRISVKSRQYQMAIYLSIVLAVMIQLAPRAYVNVRSFRYLSGQQNRDQYLRQFVDGTLDPHLQSYYNLDTSR